MRPQSALTIAILAVVAACLVLMSTPPAECQEAEDDRTVLPQRAAFLAEMRSEALHGNRAVEKHRDLFAQLVG